jgi:hypothetical protein
VKASDLVRHDVAGGNLLLGQMQFISLSLPASWNLAAEVGRPEIMAGHDRGGKKWVASGRAWYTVFDAARRWGLELALQVRSLSQRQRVDAGDRGPMTVHGHPAAVLWREVRRGLIRRRTSTILRVEFTCPRSDRHLVVELSGEAPREAFEEILSAMPYWRCH